MSTAVVSQERLLAFLGDPQSYPEHPRRIRMFHTHSAFVALTPRYAYKVKKPVNLGFLDFSTLEMRRHFCERETLLNRRLSPHTYLGVVPISICNGRLSFGTDGEIVEYAVKMRRLPERFFMDRIVDRGAVTTRDINAVIATLTPFYKEQRQTPEIGENGRVAKLRVSTDENFRQTRNFVGVTISRPAFEAIRTSTRAFYKCHAALFAARVREGRILDCHGDLHLEHIHLSPARLSIFDCIEFNDRFRYIDVANDAAFLSMDLDFHHRPDLARYFATRMARALDDPGMLQLLDFYKCYRAYVRGKVESIHQLAPGVVEAEVREIRARAERYFQLSLQYAIYGSVPLVLIVMGRVGSGKSTLARGLGRELGWEVFSSDHIRKELAGVPLYQRGAEAERRRLYGKAMSNKTYAALAGHAVEQVQEGRGAVLDATFADRKRRDTLRTTLERLGVGYCFVEAQASTATIKRRLKDREHSASEVSDARLEDLLMLDGTYEPPHELKPQHFLSVKSAGASESTVLAVLKTLAQRHAVERDINVPSAVGRAGRKWIEPDSE